MVKKGFFFTITAFLVVLLFFLFNQNALIAEQSQVNLQASAQFRIANTFMESLEEFYLPSITAVGIRDGLRGMVLDMSGGSVTYSDDTINEVLLNASLYGIFENSHPSLTNISVLLRDFEFYVNNSMRLNLSIEPVLSTFLVEQSDFFRLRARITYIVNLTGSSRHEDFLVQWFEKPIDIDTFVLIEGLPDPLFPDSHINISISRIDVGRYSIANFSDFIQNDEFQQSPNRGISFWNRLLGDNSGADLYGIERIRAELNLDDRSFVDHMSFEAFNCSNIPFGMSNLLNLTGTDLAQSGQLLFLDDRTLLSYLNSTAVSFLNTPSRQTCP